MRVSALTQLRSGPLETQRVALRRRPQIPRPRVFRVCRLAPHGRARLHPHPLRQLAAIAAIAGAVAPLATEADAPAAAEGLAAKLGLAASASALINAVALGCAWLVRSEGVVEALSGSLLLLSAAALVDVFRRAAENTRGSALQLVLECACAVVVAVQSLEGLRWLAFSHAGVEAVARAVLPVASCAWVCRLGMASPLWAEHGAAVAAADHAVTRAAAEGTAQRLLDVCAPEADSRLQSALELVSRSSRFWLGTMAALSVADWALLAALWSAMEPVMGLPASSTFAAWHLPAMLALDGARISTQLLHGVVRGRVAGAHRPALFILPAGVVSRLSLGLLFTNAACSAALVSLAAAVRSGPFALSLLPRAVLAARFLRLICECAFLVAVAGSRRNDPVTPLRLGEARDTLAACDAVWTEAPLQPIRDVKVATPALPALSALPQPPRLGLDAFSSLVLTGVRGYLRGSEAAEAVARVFAEADVDSSGEVSAAEIASWVEREAPDGGGVKWRASVRRVLGSLPAVSANIATVPPTSPAYSCAPAACESCLCFVLAFAFTDSGASDTRPQPLLDNRDAVRPRLRPRGLRLLSLEGGGIKGLALIWQLQEIEKRAGRPIHELFDLVGGTSTGGILAIALANKVSLARLEQMYLEVAEQVFGRASLLRQLRHGHSSDSAPLERILRATLGDDTFMRRPGGGQPAAFVVATRSEPSTATGGPARLELRLLRTYASAAPSGGRDAAESWRQWEAALATSAAPTILPPLRRADGSTFVDGALSGNNNPSLLVLTEGLEMAAAVNRPVDIMLSLGCGEVTASSASRSGAAPSPGSALFWLGQVVNLAFDASLQEERTVRLLSQVCPASRYARMSPGLSVDCALAEHRPAALALLRQNTQTYLRAHASDLERINDWLSQDETDTSATTRQLSAAMLL